MTIADFTSDRTAVVLVDMQIRERDVYDYWKSIVPGQKEVLRICREKDIPVVVLEYCDQGETVKDLMKLAKKVKHFRRIEKRHQDGFRETGLLDRLEEWDRECLFLMGVKAGACVLSTGIVGKSLGFQIATSEDVIAPINCDVPTSYREIGSYLHSYREIPAFS